MKYLVIILFIGLVSSCSNEQDHSGHSSHTPEKKIYTCPMHPQIIRDKPGQCPICGMDLVEKKSEGETLSDTAVNFLLKPTNEYVVSRTKTVTVQNRTLPVEFSAIGVISYDSKLVNTVSARVSGRIEKLYVKYKYQPISKGDKLMDIYSKDLLTEQENYIFLLNNDSDNRAIISASENKLQLLGLTKEQIDEVKKTKKPLQTITIYSLYSGHLHDLQPMKQGGGMSPVNMESQELSIHEGMYIDKGQTVFNIYSTERVWAILSIYAERQELLKKEMPVKLFVDGVSDSIDAKIDFIEPSVRADQKTVTARVFLENTDNLLKIGAIVKAKINATEAKGLFVPVTAIVSLGLNHIAFIKKENLFESINVQTGTRTDGWIEILSGLKPGDLVAENAQLLMDSESFIKVEKQ